MSGNAHSTPVIQHALPRHLRFLHCTRNLFVMLALACWIVPLICGLVVFAGWVVTRSEPLEFLGFVVLIAGTVAAGVGVALTICFVITNWKTSDNPIEATLLPGIVILVLIGSNFAVAAAVLRAVDWIGRHYPNPNGSMI